MSGASDTAAPVAPRERRFVQSLERGLSVLQALSAPGPGRTAAEVARATSLTRASARRFLLTLEDLGYVRGDGRGYALTPRVLDLGYAYLSSLSLPEVAEPRMRELVGAVGESASVAVLDGTDVVCVARVAAGRITAVSISVGTRLPAYASSMGRVLLAGLAPGELGDRLASSDLRPLTTATITRAGRLRAEVDAVRRQGWAIVDQELENGLRSVAVPIHGADGAVIAAMSLPTLASRRTVGDLRQALLPALLDAAGLVERDLAAGRPVAR